jgi:hypothetical protein
MSEFFSTHMKYKMSLMSILIAYVTAEHGNPKTLDKRRAYDYRSILMVKKLIIYLLKI